MATVKSGAQNKKEFPSFDETDPSKSELDDDDDGVSTTFYKSKLSIEKSGLDRSTPDPISDEGLFSSLNDVIIFIQSFM